MVRIVGVLIIAIILNGCAIFDTPSNEAKPVYGAEAFGPYGWYDYCARNRTDRDCLLIYPQKSK